MQVVPVYSKMQVQVSGEVQVLLYDEQREREREKDRKIEIIQRKGEGGRGGRSEKIMQRREKRG